MVQKEDLMNPEGSSDDTEKDEEKSIEWLSTLGMKDNVVRA